MLQRSFLFTNNCWRREKLSARILRLLPDNKSMQKTISKSNLKMILKTYGKFPCDRRHIYWRLALQLPFNKEAFAHLLHRGIHLAFKNIRKDYEFLHEPLKLNLIRLCSNLAHWFPFFAHVKYFPIAIVKFLAVFKYCPVSSFEAVATILENYCQDWFNEYPSAPNRILCFIDATVAKRDLTLSRHLEDCGFSASRIGWMQLETLFTVVLEEKSWYILWDHILVEEPKFILMAAIAFIITNRKTFLNFRKKGDFNRLKQTIKLNIHLLIATAFNLMESEISDIRFQKFVPMPKQDFYECARIDHPMEFDEYEDLNLDSLRKTELNIIKQELESKIFAHSVNQPTVKVLNIKDDFNLRKEKMGQLCVLLRGSECYTAKRYF